MGRLIILPVEQPPPDPIGVQEAADLLGVQRQTVHNAIRDGRLRGYPAWRGRRRVWVLSLAEVTAAKARWPYVPAAPPRTNRNTHAG